jgi:endonuclease-3
VTAAKSASSRLSRIFIHRPFYINIFFQKRFRKRGYNPHMEPSRERAQKVFRKLQGLYGDPKWERKSPVDELISTILSQNTSDANRDRAFTALKARFPSWEAALEASVEDIISAIRPAGLGPQKGPRIHSVLYTIKEARGRIELDFLRRMPAQEAAAWLRGLTGVGPKTAAIVMLFALGLPAFPVDTHVFRVTGRLGLRPQAMTVEAAHEHFAHLYEPAQYAAAHCPRCPLRRMCPYFRMRKRTARKS